jgi:thiamine biosynthesis lipoprotein ApbE
VTGPDLGLADALATALAVAGEPALALFHGLDGYEALVINPDGSKRQTKRFPAAPAATITDGPDGRLGPGSVTLVSVPTRAW